MGDKAWYYHYGGKGYCYEKWRVGVLAMLQSGKLTRLEVIDTATFLLYIVGPLVRSYTVCKRIIESVAVEAKLEPGQLDEAEYLVRLSIGSQVKLDNLRTDLHHFYLGSHIWRKYYGMGFMKKALRQESLYSRDVH